MKAKFLLSTLVFSSCLGLFGCSSKKRVVILTALENDRLSLLKETLVTKFPNYEISIEYKNTGAMMGELKARGVKTTADIFIDLEITNSEILLSENRDLFCDLSDFDTSGYVDSVLEYQKDCVLSDTSTRKGHKKYNIMDKEAGCIMLNTKVLKDKGLEEPESYADLLKPEYKDLIVMPNPKTSGTGYYFYNGYSSVYGHEAAVTYFSELSKNIKEFTTSGSQPIKSIDSGSAAIGLGMHFQARGYANKNPNIKIKFFEEGSPYTLFTMGIIKGKEVRPEVKEVYKYYFDEGNYLDNSNICPETIYKNPLPPKVENWAFPHKYVDMKNLLDPIYKNKALDDWRN